MLTVIGIFHLQIKPSELSTALNCIKFIAILETKMFIVQLFILDLFFWKLGLGTTEGTLYYFLLGMNNFHNEAF